MKTNSFLNNKFKTRLRKTPLFVLVMICLLWTVGCSTTEKSSFAELDELKQRMKEKASIEGDFFFPNISKEQNFEFVYSLSADSFQYDLYHSAKLEILSDKEHDKNKHAHAIHDLFFTYEQIENKAETLTFEELGHIYNIDLDSANHVSDSTIVYRDSYGDSIIEYTKDNYQGFWILNANSVEPTDYYTTKIDEIFHFLKDEKLQYAKLVVVYLERRDQVWLNFLKNDSLYKITMYVEDLQDIPTLLNGIGADH